MSNQDLAKRVASRYSGANVIALNQDFWLSPKDVEALCPPCAVKMAALGIKKIRASVVFRQSDLTKLAEQSAEEWKDLPEGWTDDSRRKFWASIDGSTTQCVKRIGGLVRDPLAFCTALQNRIEEQVGK